MESVLVLAFENIGGSSLLLWLDIVVNVLMVLLPHLAI